MRGSEVKRKAVINSPERRMTNGTKKKYRETGNFCQYRITPPKSFSPVFLFWYKRKPSSKGIKTNIPEIMRAMTEGNPFSVTKGTIKK
jgi:hypothetical protein